MAIYSQKTQKQFISVKTTHSNHSSGQVFLEWMCVMLVIGLPLSSIALNKLQTKVLTLISSSMFFSYVREETYAQCNLDYRKRKKHTKRAHRLLKKIPGYRATIFHAHRIASKCQLNMEVLFKPFFYQKNKSIHLKKITLLPKPFS